MGEEEGLSEDARVASLEYLVKQEQEQERSCGIAIVASMVVSKGLGSLRCKLTTTRRLETVKRSANGSPAHGAYSQRQGRERNAQKNQWSRHVVGRLQTLRQAKRATGKTGRQQTKVERTVKLTR